MTTDNPQFLALVAKVDAPMRPEDIWVSPAIGARLNRKHRALKVAIMAHEPMISVDGYLACSTCIDPDSWYLRRQTFPCKPFLDIESEVGK